MSKHGATHTKKHIKGKKSHIMYDCEIANRKEGECYGRVKAPLGGMRFTVELDDGTVQTCTTGNTFKKTKRNPRGEFIAIGSLVKVAFYIGLYKINHLYTDMDIVNLKEIGEIESVNTNASSTEVDVNIEEENFFENI